MLNRLTQVSYKQDDVAGNPPPTPIETATYAYDELSRLISAVNNVGTVSFTYDNRGRLKTETDVFGHVTERVHDAANRRTQLKLDGSVHTTYNYDNANRLTTLTDEASQNFTFGYDVADRLISKALPNGVNTSYEYDGMSRLKRLKDVGPSGTLFDRQYTYNTANQIDSIADLSGTRTYGYDLVDRLKTVSTNGTQTEFYNYDDVGNRTGSHLSSTYGYQSGKFNQLASTATATYKFDANGNTVSKGEGHNLWRYVWDYENRLTQASTRKQNVRYGYDALGRRVERNFGFKEQTKFSYDGLDVVMDDDNGTLTKYLNGEGIDNKLRQTTGSATSYFLADHLGSSNGLTDSTGALTASSSYDSFGNPSNSNFPSRYQFTGREYDAFSGLQFSRARFYDPKLGRFISEDPIGFGGGDINLYGYVWNNPQNFTDPMGLDGWGNNWADWVDRKVNVAEDFYGVNPVVMWNPVFGPTRLWDLPRGFGDMFRVGSGVGCAYYADGLPDYERLDLVAGDVVRGGGLFLTMAGPVAGRIGNSPKPFLPDEYYAAKYGNKAPGQAAPYGTYERFSPNGDLRQVTTYDRFGNRVRQYDVGPGTRHGEGYHEFEYGPQNPRHWPGGVLTCLSKIMTETDLNARGWFRISNLADWRGLDELLLGGEDGVIKEAHFSQGEYVDNDLNMVYDQSPSIQMLIQMQNERVPSAEFLFGAVKEISLYTTQELELSAVFSDEGVTVFFSNVGDLASPANPSKIVCGTVYYRIPDPPLLGI